MKKLNGNKLYKLCNAIHQNDVFHIWISVDDIENEIWAKTHPDYEITYSYGYPKPLKDINPLDSIGDRIPRSSDMFLVTGILPDGKNKSKISTAEHWPYVLTGNLVGIHHWLVRDGKKYLLNRDNTNRFSLWPGMY